MSEPKLISPLLDGYAMGDAITDRGGIRTCPAIDQESGDKFIVKIISTPASSQQIDALLLTGAYQDRAQAMNYYKTIAQDIIQETEVLKKLSNLDGFISAAGSQIVENEDGSGYDVYLLSPYRQTLDRYLASQPVTHLSALNLGLDLCSALTVCRRCGYMYVALKPANIYYIEDKGFKIGDIGFISLNSLKYASLADRYRSAFTPPEVEDAFASINTTIDVYAVGLILYQIFNGGISPDKDADLLAPEFADYELSEIILKACAKNPEDRWEDPAQMGHALVSYMQRNGAHDTPIVPAPVEPIEEEPIPSLTEETAEETVESTDPCAETTADELSESESTEDSSDDIAFAVPDDETLPDAQEISVDAVQITDEVSEILNQADELIAHETPAPVIPPEPIDVQLPVVDTAETEDEPTQENTNDSETPEPDTAESDTACDPLPVEEVGQEEPVDEGIEDAATDLPTDEDPDEDTEKPKSHWLRNSLITLITLCLLAGGFLFYKFYYLQHIDSLTLSGNDLNLTVYIQTKADESLLNVICYDTYGNQLPAPVVNGTAIFENLAPDCAYTVKVVISGFHSLTGEVAVNYSTPKQTNVIQFNAVTGAEDGSVVLNFAVDGPDLEEWIIRRSAANESPVDYTLSSHNYTFTGLNIGTEYTFELLSPENKQIVGNTKIMHTAAKVITAVAPKITECQDGKLTVVWNQPDSETTAKWIVHCFNEKGFDQTITTEDLTATFDGIVANDPYTVEITAEGMSSGQRVYVPENAVTVSGFKVKDTSSTSITLGWTVGNNAPANGWILRYSIDGSAVNEVTTKNADSLVLTPYIPDCTYNFELLTADSGNVIGGELVYSTKAASDFSGFSVTRNNMNFRMCLTPNVSNWTKDNVRNSDYTTTFKLNQKASFLAKMNKKYGTSSKVVYTTYVIRDSEGTVVNFATTEAKWSKMWKNNYGEFDLPALPKNAGKYTVTVYFNDAIAAQQEFTMK